MPIGGQLGGRPGGQLGGQVLPSMVSSVTPSQIAAEQTKQRELQTYIERVAAGQDKPQTVNITYYERPHPRDPNTVIVGYRATTDQPLRFQSNYTSYETQVRAGTDYKQVLEKTALQGVKAYYHLGADDTITIQGKVVQSPTYSPAVIGIAQQVAQEKQAYDVKLASLREQQQAQLKAGITFQAEQTAKLQELQAKTAGMSPTQAADYLKGELKGYYGREVLAGVRYTVGDKTFSDPKMAERYAAQLSQQQQPISRGLPQDVLKPVFVGGKPNVELFQQAKAETFYSPKYGLMTKPVSEPTLPIEQIQKEFGGINLSVISTTSRKYGEIGAEKIRKSIFDTSFLPKEIKESRGMKALYTITPYARESTARLVSFGGMVIPTTEVLGKTVFRMPTRENISPFNKPSLIPKLVLTGAVLTAGGISESIQKEPKQFLADILVSAGTMKGLSMGTGFVVRKAPIVIKFGESVISKQKPIMRSFLASEEAAVVFKPQKAIEKTAGQLHAEQVFKEWEKAQVGKPQTVFESRFATDYAKKFREREATFDRMTQIQVGKGGLMQVLETPQKAITKEVTLQKQKPFYVPVVIAGMRFITPQLTKQMIRQVQLTRQKTRQLSPAISISRLKMPTIETQIPVQVLQSVQVPILVQPTLQIQRTIQPQISIQQQKQVLIQEQILKRLPPPSPNITEPFFRRKGRKRKEKAKKGSVIAPIITPAQILRGGVLFRGSLLRRARRFK